MSYVLLTKSSTIIIGQCAVVLGWIMNAIFNFFSKFGVENIGVCIIVFTIITALIMLPMTVSQQKFMKVNGLMQPEMKAIQKKYAGKTDNASAAKQNAEIQALYSKYGVSPTGSCLPMLIQFPILFALYQVILNVPAYVDGIKDVFMNVVNAIQLQPDYINKMAELASSHSLSIDKYDYTQVNRMVDLLYKFTNSDWETLKGIFPSIEGVITPNVARINDMNSFLTINLAEKPISNLASVAILIPILAAGAQWLSTRIMQKGQEQNDTMQQMKMMNNLMPLMSLFFCFTFPAAVGIYWIASSVTRLLCQIGVNKYMDKIDVNDMIKANIEKKNRKRAKKGLPPINEQAMMQNVEKAQKISERANKNVVDTKEKRDAEQAKSTEYYNSKSSNPGSIASRAKMVKEFNERKGSKQ